MGNKKGRKRIIDLIDLEEAKLKKDGSFEADDEKFKNRKIVVKSDRDLSYLKGVA